MFDVVLLALFSLATEPSCPSNIKLNANIHSPEHIKQYITNLSINSPEKLICCLATTPGLEIAIAPTSVAGQNGDYLNPRVLIVSRNKEKNEINSIFSINSGASHLEQKDAVEMMFNDREKGLAYVDFDFAGGKSHVSKRNPELCMSCHGNNGKVPANGPRPIFDVGPWPRFLMEAPPSEDRNTSRELVGQHLCPERAKLESLLENKSANAINNNPRYACIKNLPRINIGDLDVALQNLNIKRIINFIRATPDYDKFKYVIAAAETCSDFDPDKYIPKSVLDKMKNQDSIDKDLKSLNSPGQLIEYLDRKHMALNQKANIHDKALAPLHNKITANQPIDLGDDLSASRFCSDTPTKYKDFETAENSFFPSNNVIYNRYKADSQVVGTGVSNLRYIFESRGIDISEWNMRATGGYERSYVLTAALRESEPAGSELKKALSIDSSELQCERLATLSFTAFGETVPPAATDNNSNAQ